MKNIVWQGNNVPVKTC